MNDPLDVPTPVEITELDELAVALLGAGAVLSQMMSHMIAFDASGQARAEEAPIPALARSLIGRALYDLRPEIPDEALRAAAAIVDAATDAIVQNVYLVNMADLN